jgi:hypothetical protein
MSSWNEERMARGREAPPPKEVPWRLFALEVFVVLLLVGAGCLVSSLT